MRGSIPVGDARKISRERACPLVVIFAIEPGAESFCVTTYGATKKLCKLAASFGTQIAAAILDGTVGPPETEPADVPDAPVTYHGHRVQDVHP